MIMNLVVLSLMLPSRLLSWVKTTLPKRKSENNAVHSDRIDYNTDKIKPNLGVHQDGYSYVYMASGSTPEQNMKKTIELLGGIEKIISENDIVLLKPNAQWWNQGMTNTDAMKAFMQMVLDIPGFGGEIIVADNHQYKEPNSRAWTTQHRNGMFNYNELIEYFNKQGFNNVTKYHWRCAGPNPNPLQGDASSGQRVTGPEDGDGYVWRDDIVYKAPNDHICWMTYPVFTSTYSGITIDFKNGPWKNGTYLKDRKLKFINFSALNHHGPYSGVTASVKNLMGVVDMTCGFQGSEPEGTYNVHYVGVSNMIRYKKRIHWRFRFLRSLLDKAAYKDFHYTGSALGKFMASIRIPDLNIITAEWVGWGSRTDVSKSVYPRTILASRDPVAIDYVAARDILLEVTPNTQRKYRQLNDPTLETGPFNKFLISCNNEKIGNLDPTKIKTLQIHSNK